MAHFAQLTIFLVLAVATGILADEPEKIVSGSYAGYGEFPYQVSLQVNGEHKCGGSLISNQHVLTAAHCVVDGTESMVVITGTNNLMHGGQTHRIKNAFYHSQFVNDPQASLPNDIALITLERPIVPSSVQKPIRMSRNSYIAPNTRAMLSGFGRTSPKSPTSPILLKAPMVVLDQAECQATFTQPIYRNQICAFQQSGVGACFGDSGGPLVANGELIGVVSWVIPCGIGHPDVYSKVADFHDFIDQAIRNGSQ